MAEGVVQLVPHALFNTSPVLSKSLRYFMRALADPGPGYVRWEASFEDYDGLLAGVPIQPNTVVVVDREFL